MLEKDLQIYNCDICKQACVYDTYSNHDTSKAYNKCFKITSVFRNIELDICCQCVLAALIETAIYNKEVMEFLINKSSSKTQ